MFIAFGPRAKVLKSLEEILKRAIKPAEEAAGRFATVAQLKEEIETLRIEKGRREEDFAKQAREVEHKVGLERKRQEFEVASAKREATLSVREENLKADRARFEEQMKFQTKRFEEEVGYLKTMLGDVLKQVGALTGKAARGGR